MKPSAVLGAAVGLAGAVAADVAASRRGPKHRFVMQAAALPAVAAVYPLARSRRDVSAHLVRELLALIGFSALTALAARNDPTRGAPLLAAGWVGHAVFDLVHDGGPHSLIPEWYPGFCAGYDVGVAARLLQRPTPGP
jgi:hypothetical protein